LPHVLPLRCSGCPVFCLRQAPAAKKQENGPLKKTKENVLYLPELAKDIICTHRAASRIWLGAGTWFGVWLFGHSSSLYLLPTTPTSRTPEELGFRPIIPQLIPPGI
jgi:hypothetical protein